MIRSRCTALHGFRCGKPKTFFRLAKPRSSSTVPIFAKAKRNSFSLKFAQSSDSASLPEAPSPPKGGRRCRSAVACAKVRQSGCRTGVATVANSGKLLILYHSENFKLSQLLSQKSSSKILTTVATVGFATLSFFTVSYVKLRTLSDP